MRNFRLLKAGEIECRISQVSEKGVGILLYKTARTDYQLLDETVGMYNWQNDYKVIDGKMYCGIGIKNDAEWVWKWNCGTESYTEAEKGQASDAMKRAGFAWGIGTELYSSPFIWIPAELCNIQTNKKGNLVCNDKFYVTQIAYDKNEDISELKIENGKHNTVFTYPKAFREPPQNAPVSASKPRTVNNTAKPQNGEIKLFCKDCGAELTPKVHDYSVKNYDAPYCMNCQKNHDHIRR